MTFSVYKLVIDSNNYQSLVLENDNIKWGAGGLEFAGRPLLNGWATPRFRIYDPQRDRGDFTGLGPGAIVVTNPIPGRLETMYEIAGELLPVGDNLPELSILNVTDCSDCIDYDQSEWIRGKKSGSAIRATSLVFKQSLIPESRIFKVACQPGYPQYVKTTLFTHTGMGDEEDDFKYQVESLGLRGLKFEHVWSSEG